MQSMLLLKEPNLKHGKTHASLAPHRPLTESAVPVTRPACRAVEGIECFAAHATARTFATELDLDEQAAGYQAAYSNLATAGRPAQDVVAYASDIRMLVAREFTRLLEVEPGMKTLVGMAEGSFFTSLGLHSRAPAN